MLLCRRPFEQQSESLSALEGMLTQGQDDKF